MYSTYTPVGIRLALGADGAGCHGRKDGHYIQRDFIFEDNETVTETRQYGGNV